MALKTQSNIDAISGFAGDYANVIIEQVFQSLDIAQDVTLKQNLRVPELLPKYTATDGLRPYDSSVVTPSGQAGIFSMRTITPRTVMKLLMIIPEELRSTYLGRGLAANAKEYPQGFAQFFWATQAKKIADEINRNSFNSIDPQSVLPFDPTKTYAAKDVFQFESNYYRVLAPTQQGQTPTSNPALFVNINNQCLGDGFNTILKADFAKLPASNKIATGQITDDNAFDKIISMYQSMPAEKQAIGGTFFVSYSIYQKYLNALLKKFVNGTSAFEIPGRPGLTIYGSDGKWNIKPCTWLASSQRILATQKENLMMGTDILSDLKLIGNMVPTIHGYLTKFQFILAFQFVDLDLLYVNDQE